jgi:hypothetical protein
LAVRHWPKKSPLPAHLPEAGVLRFTPLETIIAGVAVVPPGGTVRVQLDAAGEFRVALHPGRYRVALGAWQATIDLPDGEEPITLMELLSEAG